jgi:hypothetical protein
METEILPHLPVFSNGIEWYSEEYIRTCVIKYLKANGYKIHKPNAEEEGEKTIVASKFFKKEIIEVKGYPKDYYKHTNAKGVTKNSSGASQAKHWFSEALLNSLTNFGYYYSSENVTLAIALPNVDRYKAIIERVNDYFTLNNLSFKIYLVNEDGLVEASNLNSTI